MYTKKLGLIGLLAVVLMISGCASSVRTQLNTFMAEDARFGQGTIAVKAANDQLQESLEFSLYKKKLEAKLQEAGYQISTPEEARDIARLGYYVEEARARARQPNLVFTTGFGRYYRHGGIGFLVNDRTDYQDEYLRTISLVITRTPEAAGEEPRRIYETTAISKGSCPVMSVVFDEMLAAIFQYFPDHNGAVRSVTVRGEGNCR